jgi:hypothetical protein
MLLPSRIPLGAPKIKAETGVKSLPGLRVSLQQASSFGESGRRWIGSKEFIWMRAPDTYRFFRKY